MSYGECKVYFDGSHYIAIPHTTRPSRRRFRPPEEEIEVTEQEEPQTTEQEETINAEESAPSIDDDAPSSHTENEEEVESAVEKKVRSRTMTRKELFEELYQKSAGQSRSARKEFIVRNMKPYFKDEDSTIKYVEVQFERKLRNLICRRIRLTRKVNLQDFNYFCTFTYDGAKHTEESFMRKLRGCFKMMCHRKSWKYVGVWERSPEKKRLHFHGLFYIPDGAMPGELVEVKDYSPIKKKVQTTIQNTYFNERFGRSDFKTVDDRSMLGEAIAYLTKVHGKDQREASLLEGTAAVFHLGHHGRGHRLYDRE